MTSTPRTSREKAVDDQLEKRRLKCSTFNSFTYTLLDSWSSIRLRAKLLNLRFFTIAIEFMNPNLSSSSGSSRNHGCKRDDSLRWINFVKNIVDWLVEEFFQKLEMSLEKQSESSTKRFGVLAERET